MIAIVYAIAPKHLGDYVLDRDGVSVPSNRSGHDGLVRVYRWSRVGSLSVLRRANGDADFDLDIVSQSGLLAFTSPLYCGAESKLPLISEQMRSKNRVPGERTRVVCFDASALPIVVCVLSGGGDEV